MEINCFTDVKIEVYLPAENLNEMVNALNQAKAGVLGNYDHVFAISEVTGHWRPLEGSNPFIGKAGEMETAPEIKLEINCRREYVTAALLAIRSTHPYEEPLIRVIPILNNFFE